MRGGIAMKGAGLAALVLGMIAASPAMADLQVIDSNVSAYAVGAVLPDNTVFKLNAGEHVKVMILSTKATKVFEGKGSHTVEPPRGGARSVTGKKKTE